MYELDVLVPTYARPTSLAVTLTSLVGQTYQPFQVIVSDQTEMENYLDAPEITSIARAFTVRGSNLGLYKHQPRRGMAEQRNFLLSQSKAPYVLFIDDDLLLENWLIERMLRVIKEEKCGFVGSAPIGLSYINDVRPHEQDIELWEGPVQPEAISYDSIPWARHKVHNAANLYHVQQKLVANGDTQRYKVAWVGACILYDREKLLDIGGYAWWQEIPPEHAGEDVLVQLLLLRKYGGCGIIPSGSYHLELPTQVKNRSYSTDSLIERFMREQNLT
jgi:glycosyltransferase involved in cell wall biosynthesis